MWSLLFTTARRSGPACSRESRSELACAPKISKTGETCLMANRDLALYAVHSAFWGVFGLARLILRLRDRDNSGGPETAPVAQEERTARFSRAVLGFHMLAFGVMYFGVANAVLPERVPVWFPGQRVVGTLVIAGGAALMVWTLVHFRSWRFRAKLDASHRLATGGPFRIIRHPIYMGLNLLALGTALW